MRSYVLLGAAALVASSPAPAPQGFDVSKVAAITATMSKGAPVGAGPAVVTDVYDQNYAQAAASAAASGATKAAAANKRSLEKRTFCFWGFFCQTQGYSSTAQSTTSTPVKTQAPTATAPTVTAAPTSSSNPYNDVPSSCTPVSWTNTWAFTSTTACPTAIEVGTYCGFINPLDPCAPQPKAYGPPTTPDTVDNFQKNTVYHKMAYEAKTPTGYYQTFKDLNASVSANSYLAYKQLQSYDVAGCASYCNNTDLCTGFNIYIERDPAWNPAQCSCTNPTSTANYKCAIFGSDVNATSATNYGQTLTDFQVVIVASNGYNQGSAPPTTPVGWNNPQDCGKKLHDQPQYCLGQQSFPGPFDSSLCAVYAAQQNALNKKAGFWYDILAWFGFFYNSGKCVQFQAAEIEQDGAGWGTHCRLFTKKFDKSVASLDIGVSAPRFSCGKSWTFDLAA